MSELIPYRGLGCQGRVRWAAARVTWRATTVGATGRRGCLPAPARVVKRRRSQEYAALVDAAAAGPDRGRYRRAGLRPCSARS